MTNQPELSFPTFSLPFTNTKFNSSVGVSSVLLLYDGPTGLVGLVLAPTRNNNNSNGTERFHCRRIALNYPHRTSIVIRPCLWGIQLVELTARADISTDWMGWWSHHPAPATASEPLLLCRFLFRLWVTLRVRWGGRWSLHIFPSSDH